MNSHDDRSGDCFLKGFSEGVPYRQLRATEEKIPCGNKKQARTHVNHEFSGLDFAL